MRIVYVNHPKLSGLRYRCIRILARGEQTLKCGRCGCGTMLPKIGDKCAVCKSVVIGVEHFEVSEWSDL